VCNCSTALLERKKRKKRKKEKKTFLTKPVPQQDETQHNNRIVLDGDVNC